MSTSPVTAVLEHAVYACRGGHEQLHSGSCQQCRSTVFLDRWEPGRSPTQEQLAAREELRAARELLDLAKERVRVATRRVMAANDAPTVWS